jgi:hypothetical protein
VLQDPLETESSFGFPPSREASLVRHQSFGLRDSFGFPESLLEEESVLETKGLVPAARTIDLSVRVCVCVCVYERMRPPSRGNHIHACKTLKRAA